MNNYTFRRDVAQFMIDFRNADKTQQPNPWEAWRPYYNFLFGITEAYESDDGYDIWQMFDQERYGELYEPLYHTIEADMSAYTAGKQSLIPPLLRTYFQGFYADPDETTWDDEMRWYVGLTDVDRRLWENFFGHHAILSKSQEYERFSAGERTTIDPELYELLRKSDRQQLVDFVNTLENVACELNCEDLWDSKYAYNTQDLEQHLYRYKAYFDEIGPSTGLEISEENLSAIGAVIDVAHRLECGTATMPEAEQALAGIDGISDSQRVTFQQIIGQIADPDERLTTETQCGALYQTNIQIVGRDEMMLSSRFVCVNR